MIKNHPSHPSREGEDGRVCLCVSVSRTLSPKQALGQWFSLSIWNFKFCVSKIRGLIKKLWDKGSAKAEKTWIGKSRKEQMEHTIAYLTKSVSYSRSRSIQISSYVSLLKAVMQLKIRNPPKLGFYIVWAFRHFMRFISVETKEKQSLMVETNC